MPATRYPLLTTLLRRYFYSGWAFLIPYLAAYLLYYITGWPVNPSNPIGEAAPVSPLTPLTPYTSYRFLPSLLHLYWSLHALHLILAALALWSWFQDRRAASRLSAVSPYSLPATRYSPLTALAPYSSYRLHLLTRIAPWAILALLFYIPGVYLEWPSDPWEHLRRINEWRVLETVGRHSYWSKSAYFIPYSVLGWCIGLRQLFWLDFYYTGISLLLCWQYYRFSRACGLGERASMVFVVVQALLFGNNIFSFYRYYGISSSIYAQLGAVALTRIVLEWAAWGRTNLNRDTKTVSSIATAASSGYSLPPTRYPLLSIYQPPEARPCFWNLPTILWLLTSVFCLLALTAFNHPQGLGIAGLGLAAVVTWRLIEWKRSALWWLVSATITINALFLWLYPRPAIIEIYRAQGYLNAWYGFNILDLNSHAGDRMMQIVSALGLINLAAALLLFRRNHVIAWLTFTPFIALLLPGISIPFANVVSFNHDANTIVTFQRFLFSAPMVLALIEFIKTAVQRPPLSNRIKQHRKRVLIPGHNHYISLPIIVLICLSIPPKKHLYNRTWHAILSPPKDLSMKYLLGEAVNSDLIHSQKSSPRILTTITIGAVLESAGIQNVIYASRTINTPKIASILNALGAIVDNQSAIPLLLIPRMQTIYTPASFVGPMSTHWSAQEAVSCTYSELQKATINHGGGQINELGFYRLGKAKNPNAR